MITVPPATVIGVMGWRSTTAASTAFQNGSTVERIAVRTAPRTSRPRRKVMNATTVPMTAQARASPHIAGVMCPKSVPCAALQPLSVRAAPLMTYVDATAALCGPRRRCSSGMYAA